MKHKLIYMAILSALTILQGYAQDTYSSNQNYIVTIAPTVATSDINSLPSSQKMRSVQYFDGLGRPTQTIQVGASPSGSDLASFQSYDSFGRPENAWLPAPVVGNNGAFIQDLSTKITSSYNDINPYSRTVYESSPLNRVTKQIGAGKDWHTPGKGVTTEYLTNSFSGRLSAKYYTVESDGALKNNNVYQESELYVTKMTDEDGKYTYEFTDKLGRMILRRQFENGDQIDTYFVYDDFNQLRYVLPPYAADGTANAGTYRLSTNEALKLYAYYYRYDERLRCVEKKIAGIEPVYYVYDKADRLRLSQDGVQRDKNEWTFYKYDVFGREIIRGVYKKGTSTEGFSHSDMISRMTTYPTLSESFSVNGTDMYTCNSYPTTTSRMTTLITNYYDNYKYISDSGNKIPDIFRNNTAYTANVSDAEHSSAKGLLTGSKALVLDGGTKYLWTCIRYDYKAQPVQVVSMNIIEGVDKEYNKYTFTGQIKEQTIVRTNPTGLNVNLRTHNEHYRYEYDHACRLIETWHTINGRGPTLIAKTSYDEKGRVSKQQLGKGLSWNTGREYLQTINYRYNIRNWIESIESEDFKQKLYYQNGIVNGASRYYNGNISAMTMWVNNSYGGSSSTAGYTYDYDDLNRLIYATYGKGDNLLGNTNVQFDEQYEYDRHGNMLFYQGYGWTGNGTYDMVHDIEMEYNGNQLRSANNYAEPVLLYNSRYFQDYVNDYIEYIYDKNGNMITDRNRRISLIKYNQLNLPEKIQFSNGNALKFVYDATGKKHTMESITVVAGIYIPMGEMYEPASSEIKSNSKKHYCGNVIYRQATKAPYFDRAINPYGFVVDDAGSMLYWYQLKNYLGSVCAEVAEYAITNWTHYYPFGLQFDPDRAAGGNGFEGEEFSGKEGIWFNSFNSYDFGSRVYDMALARWMSIDPLAEKYYSVSPYVYCGNNPIRYIDPNGENLFDVIGGFLNAIGSNMTMGLLGNNTNFVDNPNHYNIGRAIGDVVSIGMGGQEIAGGAAVAGIGAGATVGSGGTAALPGAATVSAGIGMITQGVVIAGNAISDLVTGKGMMEASGDDNSGRTTKDPLPRDKGGNPVPDPEAQGAHSQLGTRQGKKGEYKQAREFDEKGSPVKDIDFTDHGRPQNHPNPHQHQYIDNPTGGTKQRSKLAEPLN